MMPTFADQYHFGQKVAFFFPPLPIKQLKCLGLIIIKQTNSLESSISSSFEGAVF